MFAVCRSHRFTNQQTKGLVIKLSKDVKPEDNNNKDLNRLTVTLTWHASKYSINSTTMGTSSNAPLVQFMHKLYHVTRPFSIQHKTPLFPGLSLSLSTTHTRAHTHTHTHKCQYLLPHHAPPNRLHWFHCIKADTKMLNFFYCNSCRKHKLDCRFFFF